MRIKTNELVKPHVTKNLREIDVFETEHSVDQPRFRIKQHSVALVFLQLLTSLRNPDKERTTPFDYATHIKNNIVLPHKRAI